MFARVCRSLLTTSQVQLLARLMDLLQWGHFSFLMGGSQWCCLGAASSEKNLVHLFHLCLVLSIKHSIGCSICRISSLVVVNMDRRLNFCSNPLLLTWFKKKKLSLIAIANKQIYRHVQLRKRKEAGLCET